MTARPFRFGCQVNAAGSASAWRETARRAEALGYSTLHVADHYLGPGTALAVTNHPAQEVAVIPALAALAEATSTINLGARVLCVDYHRPVVLAKELATIAWFAGGRLEVGLGAGWLASEYEAMSVPLDPVPQRLRRLEETVELVRQFLCGGAVEMHGSEVRAGGFEALPALDPADRPRIIIGGGSPRVLGLAGRLADIASVNFNNRSGRVDAAAVASGDGTRTRQKVAWVAEAAAHRDLSPELELGAYFTVVTDRREAVLRRMSAAFGTTPEALDEHPHVLVGSVEQIVEQLRGRRALYGISYFTVDSSVLDDFAPVVAALAGT